MTMHDNSPHDHRLHDHMTSDCMTTHDGHDDFVCMTTAIVHLPTRAILDMTPHAFMRQPQLIPPIVPENTTLITRINVPASSRGEGVGRCLLNLAKSLADFQEIPLALVPVASGEHSRGLSQRNLEEWYWRNQFIPVRENREGLWLRMPSILARFPG